MKPGERFYSRCDSGRCQRAVPVHMHAGDACAHHEAAERGADDVQRQRRGLRIAPRLYDFQQELLDVVDDVVEAVEGVSGDGVGRL